MQQGVGFRPHEKSKKNFKRKIKLLTQRNRSDNIRAIIKDINEFTTDGLITTESATFGKWITGSGAGYVRSYGNAGRRLRRDLRV
jgi:hypothetical protein